MLLATSSKGKADTLQRLDLIGRQGRLFGVAFSNLVVLAQLDDPSVEFRVLFVGGLDVDITIVGAVELYQDNKHRRRIM